MAAFLLSAGPMGCLQSPDLPPSQQLYPGALPSYHKSGDVSTAAANDSSISSIICESSFSSHVREEDAVNWDIHRASYHTHTSAQSAEPPLDENSLRQMLNRLHQACEPSHPPLASFSPTNPQTLAALLRSCGNARSLADGKSIHQHILRQGLHRDRLLANFLIQMYGKCGAIEDARQVFSNIKDKNVFTWTIMLRACLDCGSFNDACRIFDEMPDRNVTTWNIMIAAYVQQGCGKEALRLFDKMLSLEAPDSITFLNILPVCCSKEDLADGKNLHACIVKYGLDSDIVILNALQNMYGKCGSMEDAEGIFHNMPERDIFSWNTMISVYAQHGKGKDACELFTQMQANGVVPDNVSFVSLLDACTCLLDLQKGTKMHCKAVEGGFEMDVIVGTALINLYGNCNSLECACRIFQKMLERDLIAWNAMIEAFAKQGQHADAFELYEEMQTKGFTPDKVTFIGLLSSCISKEALHVGKQLHKDIQRTGFGSHVTIGNALINMYSKCGSLVEARSVFSQMHQRDLVTWNAIITACSEHGQGKKALELFQDMQQAGFTPNEVTIFGALDACASHPILAVGKQLHGCIKRFGLSADAVTGSALIKMYSRCGSLEDAQTVFDETIDKDVAIWNTLIGAYAQHGHGKKALEVFEQMSKSKAKPNEITFSHVLSACSHAGLLEQGRHYFTSMSEVHGITPSLEHCNILIDLIGRAGHLADGEDFINSMPVQPNATTFLTMLSACREHSDVERGKRVSKCLLKMLPESSAPYVLFSNICATDNQSDQIELSAGFERVSETAV